MIFAQRLRSLRIERGESQSELGKLINVSRQTIGNYESGARFPNDNLIIVGLCKHFNVTSDYLFGLSESRYSTSINIDSEARNRNKKEVVKNIHNIINQLNYDDLIQVNQVLHVLYSV